jgi:hypothetical protein
MGGKQMNATVLEGVGPEPGFTPPVQRIVSAAGQLSIGPYGVAIVEISEISDMVPEL